MFVQLQKDSANLLSSDFSPKLVPDDFFQTLLKYSLERSYLENYGNSISFSPSMLASNIHSTSWMKIVRLPIHPSKLEDYDLLSRWQNVLSTIHLLGHRIIVLLQRNNGITSLYFGISSINGLTNSKTVGDQLYQAFYGQMPGIELTLLDQKCFAEEIGVPISCLNACGAITGIPSPRKTDNFAMLQTLDQLSFGIRDYSGFDHNFALVAIADPVQDKDIGALSGTLLNLGTEISDKIQQNIQEGNTTGINEGSQFNLGSIVSLMLSMVPGAGKLISTAGLGLGMVSGLASSGISKGKTSTYSKSVSKQYLNKSGQYCDQIIDKYIKRLEQGRNLGFWNAGIYLLGDVETTINTACGILRSVYSGEDTHIEPIRSHLFPQNSMAASFVKQFQLIPYPYDIDKKEKYQNLTQNSGWHPLGPLFESITTPLNTEELSIATSLPRKDVPGLRFVRNAVRFASNPPFVENSPYSVSLGQIMDTGVPLNVNYTFNINSLTKHALVTGITGSGKSTTCRRLIKAACLSERSQKAPFLIIEPAKEEYATWAVEQNKHLPKEDQIHIYMPGASEFEGAILEALKINPFQPAIADGGKINMTSHIEKFKAAFNASLPMGDVLPLIVEESLIEIISVEMGPDYLKYEVPVNADITYPKIGDLPKVGDRIVTVRGYDKEIQSNIKAALRTRINALTVGWKGDIFNVDYSTPFEDLFNKNVVINLNRIADDKDKALVMSLLLIALGEYRESKFRVDKSYKNMAQEGLLCHLTVIEEAHRLLKNPQIDRDGNGNSQAVASNMFSEMLSEIRAYGQGFLIVDQVPVRLIPDAIKNTNLKIVHRIVAKDDREALSGCMGLSEEQTDTIAILPPGQAIICGDNDDAASWIKIKL